MTKNPPPKPKIPPLFLFILLTLQPLIVNSQSPGHDLATLLKLKQQWGDPPSLSHWNESSSPCNWPEISCSGDNSGNITGLRLQNKNILEPIPSVICDLESLEVIDVSYNYIPGGFPTVLYNCSKLREVSLNQNYFNGSLPEDIDRISPTIKYVDFGANYFSGDVPKAIGNLPELETLHVYSNRFTGSFPAEIGNLSKLRVLGLAYNGFYRPEIPPEFGKLGNLEILWMPECNLVGKIPESLSNLASLQVLDLSMNNLSGEIPPGLFSMKNLSAVQLYRNNLSGPIPPVIQSVNLTQIDLSMNNLNGSIPEEFGKLQQLQIMNLYSNKLSGDIPASIAQIPALKIFRVFRNTLTGRLPEEFGVHSALEAFEVSENQFTGSLPENLCAGGKLTGVIAYSNNLTGNVPPSLENCGSIRTVQLYGNKFSGEFPQSIWTLFNLSSMMISDNSFSGTLPSRVAWNLSRVEISNNRFSGPIPVGISSWKKLNVFKGSNNMFSGNVVKELTSLPELTALALDGNSLSGELPSDVISWKSLTLLNLARNKFSGPIPPVIGTLPDLLDLDLSENEFSGPIPHELGQLRLTTLNLSSNKLMGKIPFAFDNMAYENSFLNNPNLCATSPLPNVRNCYPRAQESKKFTSRLTAMISVLVSAVLLVTILCISFVLRRYSTKKQSRSNMAWKLTSFQKLDFTEANILSSLTEQNMIGSGGSGKVYRIEIGKPGEYVAVKRIWSNYKLDDTLEKEFLAEVEILGSIRHSNIVKLLCCISSDNLKLLVYEYMEHQSLDKWLHRKKKSLVHDRLTLDWPTRMQIAIGAAQGLCYMHHDCSPPIIHRDVKSSNILLDCKFKARIADFGLAKILSKHKPGEPNTMSSIAGSFGYIAPEYAYTTRVNEKIDVYSFGVILLELVTGREPSDGNGDINLAEWAWRHYGEGNSMIDVLDKEIKEVAKSYMEEIGTVFKLGLICTSTLPSSRPSMKDVVEILRRCSSLEEILVEKSVGVEYDVAPLLERESYLSSYRRGTKLSDQTDGGFIF